MQVGKILMEEFLLSKDDQEHLKTWINVTILGETVWEDEYQAKVGAEALMKRASEETYKKVVPPRRSIIFNLALTYRMTD